MSAQYFLVIKGAAHAAETFATAHGISFTFEAESRNETETYGYAPQSDKERIIDWYAKDSGLGGLFETGSLLWYALRE